MGCWGEGSGGKVGRGGGGGGSLRFCMEGVTAKRIAFEYCHAVDKEMPSKRLTTLFTVGQMLRYAAPSDKNRERKERKQKKNRKVGSRAGRQSEWNDGEKDGRKAEKGRGRREQSTRETVLTTDQM